MAKNVIIRKHEDKIEIRGPKGDLIVDIIVAKSSRTTSVNLSIQADEKYAIDKTRQTKRSAGLDDGKERPCKKYTEEEQLERRKADHAVIVN